MWYVFDEASESFMNILYGLVDVAIVAMIYITLPLWIIPYKIIRRFIDD